MKLILLAAICLLVSACSDSIGVDCVNTPEESSINISSIDEAFDIMLNKNDRDDRYTATNYLKSHLGDEMIKHYGILLFKVSNIAARKRIYESVGFFGGSGGASILAAYLDMEEEVEVKAQIICSMGLVGGEAAKYSKLIEDIGKQYASIRADNSGRQSYVVRSGNRSWLIRDDSLSSEKFSQIVNASLAKLNSR